MDNLGAILGPLLGIVLVALGRRPRRDPALDHPGAPSRSGLLLRDPRRQA